MIENKTPIKYTIVIPTRNGIKYLPYAIQSVIDTNRLDVEIIVSNNQSGDGTEDYLKKIDDTRIKVISPPCVLPMAGHYEFAMSKAQGEWVTILGDDDAVMPHIFNRLDYYIALHHEVAIISTARAYYFWEGCEDLHGNLVVSYKSIPAAKIRSTKKDMWAALAGVRSCFDLPQLYTTSIIKRELFRQIKDASGGFFYNSIIPDMYSAAALCFAQEKYLRIEEPLFWVGTSNKSMARSDRIYKDAEQFRDKHESGLFWAPNAISKDVSYELHSNGFGPVYIYEAILKSPLKSKSFDLGWARMLTLSAVLNQLKRKPKQITPHLMLVLNEEAKRGGTSMAKIKVIAFFVSLWCYWAWIVQSCKALSLRLGLFPRSLHLRSKSREKFLTIADASSAVSILLSK